MQLMCLSCLRTQRPFLRLRLRRLVHVVEYRANLPRLCRQIAP